MMLKISSLTRSVRDVRRRYQRKYWKKKAEGERGKAESILLMFKFNFAKKTYNINKGGKNEKIIRFNDSIGNGASTNV